MRIVILEDETAAAINLRSILKRVAPEAEVVETLESVAEGIEWFRTHPAPDLLFADIHLADGESFRLFEAVEITAPVVFTTAYDRYALEAFRLDSIDYLLKPINEQSVLRALEKLRRLTGLEIKEYGSRVKRLAAARSEQAFLVQVRDKIIPLPVHRGAPGREGDHGVVRKPAVAGPDGTDPRADHRIQGPVARIQGVAAFGSPRGIGG